MVARFVPLLKIKRRGVVWLRVALGTLLSGAACAASVTTTSNAGGDDPVVELARWSPGLEATSPSCWQEGELDAACLRTRYEHVPRQWPAPDMDEAERWLEWGPIPGPGSDAQHEAALDASNKQIVALGARLFFDKRLSRRQQISCASCHQPDKSFSDGKALAIGEDGLMGKRRTPPLFAAPFAKDLFWDGRVQTLQDQVLGPIENPVEMNHALRDLIVRLRTLDDYPQAFQQAFGPAWNAGVDAQGLARALAAYVVTLRPAATRFDDFLAGNVAALNDQELTGLHLFRTKARCMNCHNGPLLTDNRFHNIGLSFYGRRLQDLGRFEWSRDPADLGLFRTPSLRNVARAGPWMHNGLFPSLEGVVRMYDAGMIPDAGQAGPLIPRKSPRIRKLNLSEAEIQALLAFLQVL